MKKIQIVGLLLIFGLTINQVIGQNDYTDFTEELHVEVAYIKSPTPSTCAGEIEIVHSKLSPPYSYSIDGGNTFSSTSIFSGLCAKKYFVHVRDGEGKLGLTLVNFPMSIEEVPVSFDTTQLLADFENATDPIEKRSLQSKLSVIGIKFPADITKLSDNVYSFPLIRIPSNSEAFAKRTENTYDKIKKVSLTQDNLVIEFIDFEEGYLDSVVERLGYSGFELINE